MFKGYPYPQSLLDNSSSKSYCKTSMFGGAPNKFYKGEKPVTRKLTFVPLAICALLLGALVINHNALAAEAINGQTVFVQKFIEWNGHPLPRPSFMQVVYPHAKSFEDFLFASQNLPLNYANERKAVLEALKKSARTASELVRVSQFHTENLGGISYADQAVIMTAFYRQVVAKATPADRSAICEVAQQMAPGELEAFLKSNRAPDGKTLFQHFGCGR